MRGSVPPAASRSRERTSVAPRELPGSPALRRALAVVAFAALTAVGARVALPLPGTPVPFTFQVAAVLLAGFLLGPRLGAASQGAYLAAGLAGLPVFTAGGGAAYLLGPTGGYLLAYPLAAAAVGWIAGRGAGLGSEVAGLLAGIAVIYAGGAAWLGVVAGPDLALAAGVLPFLVPDLLKALLALLVGRRLRSGTRRLLT